MDALQHDPRTKLQIKEALYEFLYNPLMKAYKTRIDIIIVKNAMVSRSQYMSFIYKGEVYSCDASVLPRQATRLAPEFHKEMDEYLRDKAELDNKEIPYVIGFINQVLNSTNELHDYLKVLPDSVHAPIQSLIATCPCRAVKMTDTQASNLKVSNSTAISLIKQRLLSNLLY